ncbi:hypothetical protein IAT40_006898 [Kwoniella sp. CBS 6097]
MTSSLPQGAGVTKEKDEPNQREHERKRIRKRSITTPQLLALSFLIQAGLLLYANHIDSHPERYGGLKYTDVDWRVVSDGAKLIFNPSEGEGNIARGWLVRRLGLRIGDPYERATFRYTPLLALLISPSLIHPLLGRLLLVIISLCIPPLLLSLPRSGSVRNPIPTPTPSSSSRPSPSPTQSRSQNSQCSFWAVHGLWTLNPFVLNITTRGSPESIICLLVILLLVSLKRGKEVQAAVWLGLAVSWKIYPAVYVPAIWTYLAVYEKSRQPASVVRGQTKGELERSTSGGWFGWRVWRFGLVAASTFGLMNGLLWTIWGQPFLEHTYLYHLTRQDHRHNFSPYFYPIYLSFYTITNTTSTASIYTSALLPFTGTSTTISTATATAAELISNVVRHPLTSFLPQLSLVLLSGFGLASATTTTTTTGGLGGSLEFAMFVQTAVFVAFNKVCTSQYFMWFLPLIPPILPSLRSNPNPNPNPSSPSSSSSSSVSWRKVVVLIGGWITAQAVWLGTAYQLELMGKSVYLALWAAGLGLFGVSCWVLGELIDAFEN